jgi:hypothetical protein
VPDMIYCSLARRELCSLNLHAKDASHPPRSACVQIAEQLSRVFDVRRVEAFDEPRTVAIVLDFVQPAVSARRLVYQAREFGFDPFRR